MNDAMCKPIVSVDASSVEEAIKALEVTLENIKKCKFDLHKDDDPFVWVTWKNENGEIF